MLNLTAVFSESAVDVFATLTLEDVSANTTAPATNGTASVFVSVAAKSSGATLVTNQVLTYRTPGGAIAAGTFSGTVPAALMSDSPAGYTFTVSVYGPAGLTDTLLLTAPFNVPNKSS